MKLSPYGSWLLKSAPKQKGAEPDECYIAGDQEKDVPDIVIDVIWTHGGIDKLSIYKALGVREVWFWQHEDRIQAHVLRGDGYVPSPRSEVLPELELELLVTFLDRETAIDAMRDFREALRKK